MENKGDPKKAKKGNGGANSGEVFFFSLTFINARVLRTWPTGLPFGKIKQLSKSKGSSAIELCSGLAVALPFASTLSWWFLPCAFHRSEKWVLSSFLGVGSHEHQRETTRNPPHWRFSYIEPHPTTTRADPPRPIRELSEPLLRQKLLEPPLVAGQSGQLLRSQHHGCILLKIWSPKLASQTKQTNKPRKKKEPPQKNIKQRTLSPNHPQGNRAFLLASLEEFPPQTKSAAALHKADDVTPSRVPASPRECNTDNQKPETHQNFAKNKKRGPSQNQPGKKKPAA